MHDGTDDDMLGREDHDWRTNKPDSNRAEGATDEDATGLDVGVSEEVFALELGAELEAVEPTDMIVFLSLVPFFQVQNPRVMY